MKHLKYVIVALYLFAPAAEGGDALMSKNRVAQINDRLDRIERINHLLGYQMEITYSGMQTVMDAVIGTLNSPEDKKELAAVVRAAIADWSTKKTQALEADLREFGVEP